MVLRICEPLRLMFSRAFILNYVNSVLWNAPELCESDVRGSITHTQTRTILLKGRFFTNKKGNLSSLILGNNFHRAHLIGTRDKRKAHNSLIASFVPTIPIPLHSHSALNNRFQKFIITRQLINVIHSLFGHLKYLQFLIAEMAFSKMIYLLVD